MMMYDALYMEARRVELLNSKADLEAADRRFHFHSQTDPTKLETDGPFTIARGQGPYVFDLEGGNISTRSHRSGAQA
jgi:hypothetical protein